jgi:hypothetical protein
VRWNRNLSNARSVGSNIMENLLNFSEIQKDKPIFRFLSKDRLFQIFEKHANVLVNPKLWEDPFENYIANSITQLKFEDEQNICIGFRDNFYGQSWTQTRESDAMWRVYSPDKNGARIMTTPRKLLKSLYEHCGDDISNYSCFLGKVKYYKTKELKTYISNNVDKWVYFDPTGNGLAQSLLCKRTSFKHEDEVRLLFNSKFKGEKNPNILSYRFNPLDIIDSIVFDPRIDYAEFKKYKERLIELRFKNKIVKSNLYKNPDFKIESKY